MKKTRRPGEPLSFLNLYLMKKYYLKNVVQKYCFVVN